MQLRIPMYTQAIYRNCSLRKLLHAQILTATPYRDCHAQQSSRAGKKIYLAESPGVAVRNDNIFITI